MNRFGLRAVILIYWGYVLIVTFHPFELSPEFPLSLNHLAAAFGRLVLDDWHWLGKTDFILNILLFLPCGALVYALWQNDNSPNVLVIVLVTLCGALASFLIEYVQAFASRNSSVLDVIANTLGSALGALAYAACKRRGHDPLELSVGCLSSKIMLCGVMLIGALPLVFSVEQFIAPFWRWDSQTSLQIGNAPPWKRPWLGEIHLVALYSRALVPAEVGTNFGAGLGAGARTKRTKKDLIALYEFAESTGHIAHDTSQFRSALDLRLSPRSRVRWLKSSGGVEITKRGIIRSHEPATKLVNALKETNALSLEIWMIPNSKREKEPARILSLSHNSRGGNLMLFQHGADLDFRLQTPASGDGGRAVGLRTSDGLLTAEKAHVVVTYKDGIERLYVNGVERPESVNLARAGIVGFGTRRTDFAQMAYSFFYFLPLSFVGAIYISSRSTDRPYRWLVPAVIVAALSLTVETAQALTLGTAVGLQTTANSVLVGIGGGLAGRAFARGHGQARRFCPPNRTYLPGPLSGPAA